MAEAMNTLRELAEKVSPGRWRADGPWVLHREGNRAWGLRAGNAAAYVAACDPQTILGLLDTAESLRAEVERLQAEATQRENTCWYAIGGKPVAHHFVLDAGVPRCTVCRRVAT